MRRPTRSLAASLSFAALLYGAMALAANAALALTPAERDALKALGTGEMASLVVHDAPRPAPETVFRDGSGGEVTLADYAGKVVVVNVWATWCPPCRAEMPALDALAGAMEGPDFELIALSTDRGGAPRVEDFFAEIGVRNLEVMLDPKSRFMRAAGIMGLPVTLILDREGREIARMIGDADWDSPEARDLIRRVIEMTGDTAGEAGEPGGTEA